MYLAHSHSHHPSSDSNFLFTPKTTTVDNKNRSFVAIAPKLWNQLPFAIRQSNSVGKSFETFICTVEYDFKKFNKLLLL